MLAESVRTLGEHMFVGRWRPEAEVAAALALCAAGHSDREVGRRLGIPCRTINGWRRGSRRWQPTDWSAWRPPDGPGYCLPARDLSRRRAYHGFSWQEVKSHAGFPRCGIPRHCGRDLERDEGHVPGSASNDAAVCGGRLCQPPDLPPSAVLCVPPARPRLLGGRIATYAYPRYFFTNYSADIRRIFCEHCERLGIRWTQSNPRNISVAHRDSVAILDTFVGPKQ